MTHGQIKFHDNSANVGFDPVALLCGLPVAVAIDGHEKHKEPQRSDRALFAISCVLCGYLLAPVEYALILVSVMVATRR